MLKPSTKNLRGYLQARGDLLIMRILQSRLKKAILIILLIFLLLFTCVILNNFSDFFKMINVDTEYSSNLPANFLHELSNIYEIGASNIKVSDTKKVIGFELNYDAKKSFSIIKDELKKNNWTFFESGSECLGSFSKKGGIYNWALINCTNISNTTSVVITLD